LRELRRIFVHKRDEVMGGWRKLYYEELQSLHKISEQPFWGGKIKNARWTGHTARMEKLRNACKNFSCKSRTNG
jgi:hypothetical protein